MNRSAIKKFSLVIVLTFLSLYTLAAATADRNIEIAGLVVNAQTLAPVASVKIYDSESNLLGLTDKNGYFKVTLHYIKSGELNFRLKLFKKGYQAIFQHEHWGDLPDGSKNIFYFGLKEANSNTKSFSALADNASVVDLTYTKVLSGFKHVEERKVFENKLESAKAGNENVLINIDDGLYIVNTAGWIKINAASELVIINDKQVLAAGKLNTTVKRSDVKWMSPVEGKEAKFAIHTR